MNNKYNTNVTNVGSEPILSPYSPSAVKAIENFFVDDIQPQKEIVPVDNLRSDELFLKKPLYVIIEENHNIVIAENTDLNIWGEGETQREAIIDLTESILDIYKTLEKNKEKLGKEMKITWNYLNTIIKKGKNNVNAT